jgi:ribosome-binding factor A
MPHASRAARVGDQIRAELASLLTRDLHDPGIGFVTLTHVKLSPYLQQARVYYTTIGDDKARRETARALERATPFLRRRIGSRLRLRRVPEITFTFDQAIEKSDRIEQILRELNTERDGQQGTGESPGNDTTEPRDDDQ